MSAISNYENHRPLSRLAAIAVILWIAAPVARVTVFSGGGVGGAVTVGAFVVLTLALLALSAKSIGARAQARPLPRGLGVLIAVMVLAFFGSIALPDGPWDVLSTVVFLLSLPFALVLLIRRARGTRGGTSSGGGVHIG